MFEQIALCPCRGSSKRLVIQHIQIPPKTSEEDKKNCITVLKWLFPPHFSNTKRFTCSRPDIVLVVPISSKAHEQNNREGGGLSRPIVGCDDSCDLVSWFFS